MSPPQAPAQVLIVDDLEVNRDLLLRRVQRLGNATTCASGGQEALHHLRAARFDLVLLDITMPGMDGYEVLAQIKADPRLAPIPVVMVTAIDGVDSVVRCLELGADDTITKPFNPVVLRARIESSLNKKRVADLNARLLQSLSRELAIAQRIQLGFLPEALPEVPGWPLAAFCTPARQVGGDFFDAWMLPNAGLVLTVADVCDKGVGAALYMTLFRSLLRISLQQAAAQHPAAQALELALAQTNDYVATVHARDNMFATVFAAVLDTSSGKLDFINAGHDAPLLARGGRGDIEPLEPEGLALGMMPAQAHRARQIELQPGDRLLAFSDGLPEALNNQGEAFGSSRIRQALQTCGGSPRDLLAELKQRLDHHVGELEAHDDVTLLALRAG